MAKVVKLTPLSGYALIKPEEAAERTESGLYLPDTAKEQQARGKVIAIGAAKKHPDHEEKAEFKVGDSVIYKKWGGDELKINGEEYKLVEFKDVMAIIEN